MTTIAFKDGIVAADTGMTGGGGSRVGHTVKIVRRMSCVAPVAFDVAGASGCASWGHAFKTWFTKGENGDPPPIAHENQRDDATGVIFRADGSIWVFHSSGRHDLRAPYFAMGSGGSEARGAMQVGASAEDAVRAAMVLDESTYGDVTVLRVGRE
jgi:hypothetical protein